MCRGRRNNDGQLATCFPGLYSTSPFLDTFYHHRLDLQKSILGREKGKARLRILLRQRLRMDTVKLPPPLKLWWTSRRGKEKRETNIPKRPATRRGLFYKNPG